MMYQDQLQSGMLLTDGKDKGIPMYYRRKIIEKIGKSDSMAMRLALKKRASMKDAELEKTLRSRGGDPNAWVDKARAQSEIELKARLKRSGKSDL